MSGVDSGVVGGPAGPSRAVADAHGRDVVRAAEGALAELNQAEILTAADVQTARRLGALTGTTSADVLLAVALTVRAARHGSVCLELARVAELDPERAWPDPEPWVAALLESPLVRDPSATGTTPLVLEGGLLYLDRYWGEERQVFDDLTLRARAVTSPPPRLEGLLDTYFPASSHAEQREAARTIVTHPTAVLTGGPGTGKTTTIARLLGVLLEQDPTLRIALAAPTGRAAARLGQAVAGAVAAPGFPPEHAERLASLPASTLHRLLGTIPDNGSRFRHHRGNTLPLDVVVVDETSMVSLTMMARLLEALGPGTRLVLAGDPDQLDSVDAGAVLGDLVGGLGAAAAADPTHTSPVARLETSHRFGERIGALAAAIRDGEADAALELLQSGGETELIAHRDVGDLVLAQANRLRAAAAAADSAAALAVLDRHRLLCAHREGPYGAHTWNRRVERLLAQAEHRPGGLAPWYPGRPLLITANDYALGLYNGDTGVVVADPRRPGGLVARIADGVTTHGRPYAVGRLSQVRSAHAMTVHRSQGSQVAEVTVLLPEDSSRLLTRQLLYTAVTRATHRVRVAGTPDAVRAAVSASVQRASGLAARLTR